MTNHWIDLRNSDCILVIGANPARNHPVSFSWINAAKDRGAKLVVVEPRFTRTAARAEVYAPLRSGTDIAFLGGMIRHVLENNLYHREYVAGPYRLYVCRSCRRYLKGMVVGTVAPNVLLPLQRILTTGLDVAAVDAGYRPA